MFLALVVVSVLYFHFNKQSFLRQNSFGGIKVEKVVGAQEESTSSRSIMCRDFWMCATKTASYDTTLYVSVINTTRGVCHHTVC